MTDQIRIAGVPELDGEYEFDFEALTNRDLRTIKQVSGVVGAAVLEQLTAGDQDVVIALAVIALRHSGRLGNEARAVDLMMDAPVGKIEIVWDDSKADEIDPKAQRPEDDKTISTRSGVPSQSDSESLDPIPLRTGDPSSERSGYGHAI